MLRRYSSRAGSRARELLSKGFEHLDSAGHRKSPEELGKLVGAGRELGIPEDIVRQAYRAAKSGPAEFKPSMKAVQQADTSMFTVPSPQDFRQPFQFDDIPSAGHLQLEEHRDQRYYTRVAAYELPQLVQYRANYSVPDPSSSFLRFRFVTVLGEDHPATRKVVLTFRTSDVPDMTRVQLHKLRLLAGPRYDMASDEVRIACSRFPQQAQNKRFLARIFERLIAAARDPATDAEIAEIPLDPRPSIRRQRHRRPLYPQHPFPKAWQRPDMAPKPKEDIVSVLSRGGLPQ